MSKHTPGPWKAVYVGSSDWDLNGPVTEQDWKLAAAAPDLLKSLQKFINVMESCSYYPDTASERHALCQAAVKAKAAIFKATGEA
jgi:hypothetical protein